MASFNEIFTSDLIKRREDKLRKFWAKSSDSPRSLMQIHDGLRFPVRQMENEEDIINNAVQQMISSAFMSEDYLPWFGPDFGTISTAKYWGGEVLYPEDGCAFIKPVIYSPEDIDMLVLPEPAEKKDVNLAKKLAKQVAERAQSYRFWVRSVDFQGPLSTAGLLWEQTDFFCSMSTNPDQVHRLMEMVTDQLIAMMNALKSEVGPQCGPTWPYIWLPDDIGFGFTEDLMPLMSPSLYKEFGAPYMKKLADAAGGAFIHCCGEFEQHLEILRDSGANIIGFDYCEPHTRTEAIYDVFGPDLVYHVGISPQGEKLWGDTANFISSYLAKTAPSDMRFYFCIDTAFSDANNRRQAILEHML